MTAVPDPVLSFYQPQRKRRELRFSPYAVMGLLMLLAVIAGVALFSFYAAALLYGLLVLSLALTAPHYVLLLIFATAPFAYDVGGIGVAMAASELTLAAALPFLLLRINNASWKRLASPLWIPMLLYLGFCVFSTIANASFQYSVSAIAQMFIYLVICHFIFSVALPDHRSIIPAFYGLIAGCCILSLIVIVTRSAFIFGLHKNLVGTELMYSVIIAFELWIAKSARRVPRKMNLFYLVLLTAGLVIAVSRGAWIGAFVGIMIILTLRRRFGLAVRAMLLLIPIVIIAWVLLPEEKKDYVTNLDTNSQHTSAGTRVISINYAMSFFNQSTNSRIYGVGVGLRKIADATNVVIFTLAEVGVIGLCLFLSIFATIIVMAWKIQKRLPHSDPVFSLLTIGVALMLGKFCHGLVDHYWSRGVIPVWAGAGFISYAWCYSRKLPLIARAPRPQQRIRVTRVDVPRPAGAPQPFPDVHDLPGDPL